MKILYVDSTVRRGSRTAALAKHLLNRLDGDIETAKLSEMDFPKTDESFLSRRDKACAAGDHSGELFAPARQFAKADVIVIAAPFWDLSFPASLKQYFEQINVLGLTFDYTADGRPVGLCRAKKLYYVTTAGGPVYSEEYGYGYVRALARTFYGIDDCTLIKAECLDIMGADVEALLNAARLEIDRLELP